MRLLSLMKIQAFYPTLLAGQPFAAMGAQAAIGAAGCGGRIRNSVAIALRHLHQAEYVVLSFSKRPNNHNSEMLSRSARFTANRIGVARPARLWINVASLILLLTTLSSARSHKSSPSPLTPSDPSYVLALSTANRFLYAWQSGDLADGMLLLSDALRHSQKPDTLEQFFSSGTDRAFEINAGHRNRGRYSFRVVLVSCGEDGQVATSQSSSPSHHLLSRRASTIILVSAGKNDWVVDKLP